MLPVLAVAWAKRKSSSTSLPPLPDGIAHIRLAPVRWSRYSLLFASRGANVVVNDFNAAAAQKVVDEITKGAYPE